MNLVNLDGKTLWCVEIKVPLGLSCGNLSKWENGVNRLCCAPAAEPKEYYWGHEWPSLLQRRLGVRK